ncbi:MAG: hypothetical protein FWF15_02625 [Oscillospiraceae bacterium]|nr:hypothetical protein [Oscillospiraceae bacterium]
MKKLIFVSLICLLAISLSILPVSAHDAVTYAEWGTPVIDGVRDAIWDKANMFEVKDPPERYIDFPANQAATGKVWTLWDGEFLYLYIEVKDAIIDSELKDGLWNQDAVGIMLDFAYIREPEVSFRDLPEGDRYAGYFNVSPIANETTHFAPEGPTIYGLDEYVSKTKTFCKIVDGGYVIEAQIPLIYKQYKPGDKIGLEIFINNAIGNQERESIMMWKDSDGALGEQSWQYSANMGTVIFNEQVIEVIVEEVEETPATVAPTTPAVTSPQTDDCSIFVILMGLAISCLMVKTLRPSKKKI